MEKNADSSAGAAHLRRMAEEKLRATRGESPLPTTEADVLRLVLDLQVHQIELEMQNDELRQATEDVVVLLEKYTDLYDFAPVGYFTLDRLGNIRQANLTGANLIGANRARLIHTRFGLYVMPESRPTFNAFFASVFELETKQTTAVYLRAEDGSIHYLLMDGVAASNDECHLAAVDLTKRNLIEKALQESEESYRLLFNTHIESVGIHGFKENGEPANFIQVNDALCERLGYTREEMLSLSPLDVDAPDKLGQMPAVMEELRKKKRVCFETEHIAKDGCRIPVEISCVLFQRGDGEAVLAVARDITDRKRAEAELARSHEQVAGILESISDAFFALDQDWRFVYVNREAENVLRISRQQLMGANIFDHFPGAVGSMFQEQFHRVMSEGIVVKFESYSPALGAWLDVRAYPYKGGISVYFQDCTERRIAQDSLSRKAQRDHHISEVLQQTLIPQHVPPPPKGYEIAVRYQPALSEAEVCGDFYDLIDLGDGKLGIVIGDVVGKGLRAATRVSAVRHSIRSYTFLDDPPSTVMTRVNNAIYRDIVSENDMLTAFLAVLDTRDGTLSYSSAGHEPPVLRRSDGSVEYLSVRGPMFTGLSEPVYPEGRATLEMGDLLVMFTDGITEARNSDDWELFGIEGVERRLSKNADASAEQIASGLMEDAVTYAHGALRDDVAIIVIKRVVSSEEPEASGVRDACQASVS